MMILDTKRQPVHRRLQTHTRSATTLGAALMGSLMCVMMFATAARAADEFLEPELAFKPSAGVASERAVEITFDVAPGYYLYRERFAFAAPAAVLGPAAIPPGRLKFDETFNRKLETHRGSLRIVLPVKQAPARFPLTVTYQGCADKGLCYPPAQLELEVSLSAFGGSATVRPTAPAGVRR